MENVTGRKGSQHPLGVQPFGLAYLAGEHDSSSVRNHGLGKLARLHDAHVCQVLEHCDAQTLTRFSAASRVAYCFANHEDLWRSLVLQVSLAYAL